MEEELKKLREKVKELTLMHQLDMAEIVRLRRWIQRLEEKR